MTPYDIARTYIGTTEGPGPADNPKILEMYATIGQDWVEHDDVAWCAAFVGHCLEQAGLRSTRKLTARSYLEWGVPVELAEAQEGDIVVFRRGSSEWQGHVGFFVAQSGQMIEVLGGNQSDAVNIKRSAASKLLGVRRASADALARPAENGLSVEHFQESCGGWGTMRSAALTGLWGARPGGPFWRSAPIRICHWCRSSTQSSSTRWPAPRAAPYRPSGPPACPRARGS